MGWHHGAKRHISQPVCRLAAQPLAQSRGRGRPTVPTSRASCSSAGTICSLTSRTAEATPASCRSAPAGPSTGLETQAELMESLRHASREGASKRTRSFGGTEARLNETAYEVHVFGASAQRVASIYRNEEDCGYCGLMSLLLGGGGGHCQTS